MRDITKSRWPRLSPLLDELLDLDAEARAARLDALRADDPGLAADLQTLLARDEVLEEQAFLEAPVLPTLTATLLVAGENIGAYMLEREIGHGGMGSVWLARRTDGRFEGQVAIKFLSSGLLGAGDSGRFAREGQILGRLAHPHIARLLDAGVAHEGHQPYLVLEYVDGQPIDRYCQAQQLDVEARVRLFLDVLAAVAHAHQRLILHRDLKPSNILVTPQGEVKLLDFGIAKLLDDASQAEQGTAATELTQRAGSAFTPHYAAPEQVQQGDVTTATDVYALGVLLYLLLGGRHPTAQDTQTSLDRLRAVVELEPKRLSDAARQHEDPAVARQARQLRGDLDTIVAKALKKKPSERYANAEQLAADLRHWLAHEPITARPDSRWYRGALFLRRHRLGVGAGSVAVLALGVGVGVALWEGREARHQRDQAEGLIEFMLGDLRKKLEPVGRLDVLDSVGEKALGYYDQQDLARGDADSLGRRARALHLMGEIAEKRGKMAEASQRFREAADTTAELLARDPLQPQRLFDHGQSVYWVGYTAMRQGQMEQAHGQFEHYLALSQKLVQLEPQKTEWQVELASAQTNLGVLLLRHSAVQAAQERFEAARAIWLRLLPVKPALRGELSATLGWLAEAQEILGLFDASIASHQEKLKALQSAGPQDRKAQDREAATRLALSRLHLSAGRGAAAMEAALAAREGYAGLAAVDVDNLDMLARLGFARMQVAETALALQQPGTARAELSALGPALARLLAADAAKPAWTVKLRGRWLAARTAVTANRAELHPSRSELADFLDRHPPAAAGTKADTLDTDGRWVLALAALRLGDAWVDEDPAKAAGHWQTVLQHLRPSSQGAIEDPRVTSLRANALLRLDRPQEARTLADKLAVSAYRHPEWQGLLARRLVERQ